MDTRDNQEANNSDLEQEQEHQQELQDKATDTEVNNVNDADEAETEPAAPPALDQAAKNTLIADLSAICEVDNKTAEGMLEAHNWNMQETIDAFLDESRNEVMIIDDDDDGPSPSSSSSNPAVVVDLTEDQTSPEIRKEVSVEKERTVTVTLPSPRRSPSPGSSDENESFSTWAPEKLSIISWNLDGLDDKNLEKRTEAVLEQLLKEDHAIIFLQELIPQTFDYLARKLNSTYLPIPGTKDPSAQYLTGTFLRRNRVIYEDHQIIPFPGTSMGRTLHITKAFIGRAKLYLLNTHLESTAEFTTERQNQLKFCFGKCGEFSEDYNVIFGGDLNLRDKEVSNVAANMVDLWIKCGARETCKYTWDLTRNTNKQMPSRFQPRLRFDRLYFRTSKPETLTPEFFGVTGIEKVAGTQSFPSDHWAIMSFFALSKEARKPLPKKRKAENITTEDVEYISR